MLIVRSPVRISFGGGGTDLPAYYEHFGGAVLSASINKYIYTVLCRRNDDKIQVISSDLRTLETWRNISQMSPKGSELEIPLAALKHLGADIAVDLFLASEIPPGTGLGSSASVCVNVLKTLTTYLDRPVSKYSLAETAFHIARETLGMPVGKQDEYAAAFGGLNFIEFHRTGRVDVAPFDLPAGVMDDLEQSLMLFFVGSTHQSWNILKEQEKNTQTQSSQAVDALHQIRELANRVRSVLQEGNIRGFGSLLDEGWKFKKRVSSKISNERIDELYTLALRHGAYGGKLTGAGGGGFLLLCCPIDRQVELRESMANMKVREMAFSFDLHGAQVVVNDPFIDQDERCGVPWVFVPNAQTAQRVV